MYKRKIRFPADYNSTVKTVKFDAACARYSMGMATMRRVAEEAGAVVRIGRSCFVNVDKVDSYLDAISE